MKMKLSIALVCFFSVFSLQTYTSLNYHDMFPPYTTLSHFDLMNQESRETIKGRDAKGIYERIQVSTSMVAQKATNARDLNKVKVVAGDVHGRLNMIGLTYGSVPTGATQPALLTTAAALSLAGATGATVGNSTYSDLQHNFGFFSLPIKYRKIGARFNICVRVLDDVVFSVKTGVVDMKQTMTHYVDKTGNALDQDVFHTIGTDPVTDADKTVIETNLMDKRTAIFTQMGIDGEDWNKSGVEDIHIGFSWRHNFKINADKHEEDWAPFLFTPHINVVGSFGVGKKKDPDVLLSLPFGNNGHHAVHASAGWTLDFYDSVEISMEGGTTHYFDNTYITRVPTDRLQSLLFPYKTSVKVAPGKTWHMSVCMNAHNFVDRLSLFAQYSYLNHSRDTITLTTADSAFLPARLEEQTNYKVQMAQIGLNYDLSPNMSVGFLWQAPLSQRGSYKAHTLMLSGILTF